VVPNNGEFARLFVGGDVSGAFGHVVLLQINVAIHKTRFSIVQERFLPQSTLRAPSEKGFLCVHFGFAQYRLCGLSGANVR
ncbi:MAG TPA: hypothetical protein PKH47_16595, partial [Anaerolineales bacterium]|nr:hypothetical protein [Anaerolineales bacterium]